MVDIEAGAPILRYGSVIGYAEGAIPKGSWVHEERVRLPVAPALDALPLATAVRLHVDASLHGTEGPLPLGAAHDASFATYGPLAVKEAACWLKKLAGELLNYDDAAVAKILATKFFTEVMCDDKTVS